LLYAFRRYASGLDSERDTVASTQEIIGQLQNGKQKITDTIQVLSAAENTAAQMQQQMGAMGVQDKAAQFGAVRESIKKIIQHINGGTQLVDQTVNQTRQAGAGGG
jgi:ABC-type transporter Mla subunit MlaD